MDYLLILGNRIRERRTALGISQAELAEAAGYSQKGMISRVEQGKVSLQTVTKNSWARISREMGSKTSPYSLRHTFISFMAQALPEQALKDWVGHSVRMDTYGVYAHAVNGDMEKNSQMANIALVEKLK